MSIHRNNIDSCNSRAGHNYVITIRDHQGAELEPAPSASFQTSIGFCAGLDKMFESAESLFEDYPNITIEEYIEHKKMKVSLGQRYDVEQLMEHAIVHVLRHRRQIERFLLTLGT